MIKALYARMLQGHRTVRFPAQPPTLPERFMGRPALNAAACAKDCCRCVEICPSGAMQADARGGVQLDLGRCIFCGACAKGCPAGALKHTREYRMAVRKRGEMIIGGGIVSADPTGRGKASAFAEASADKCCAPTTNGAPTPTAGSELRSREYHLAEALERKSRRLFGRSLKLRQVSAGGCNACEADHNVLTTVVFDMGRFGIQFVASPRHADGLLITGPVTRNMTLALKKTYDAVPEPKLVIASGACAISGGLYASSCCRGVACYAPTEGKSASGSGAGVGVDAHLPVDLYIPGCPPHPITILDGLLRLLGRIEG